MITDQEYSAIIKHYIAEADRASPKAGAAVAAACIVTIDYMEQKAIATVLARIAEVI